MARQRIVLVGGGGHTSDVLQAIEALNALDRTYDVVGLIDDVEVDLRRFAGRGVTQIGTVDDLAALGAAFVLAVGWPATRRSLAERIGDRGTAAGPIVHPRTDVGHTVELGAGSVVLGGAHLSPLARLGVHSLVSYNASVGHDVEVGDFATVLPNAAIGGGVAAGDDLLVGAGATVRQGTRLGHRVTIGAGAAVVADVADDTTVLGIPAKPSR